MANVKEQCESCVYWKHSGGGYGGSPEYRMCFHMYETGKRRVEVDGICRSHKSRGGENGN